MPRIIQWERDIGRRLRLRDLFVFFTVTECGSMAKAASRLGVSTPSISDTISELEQSLQVRLLDRTPKGVLPTLYGEALLKRGHAAFDELRQGILELESISDPGTGEVRIGCAESLSAYLTLVVERLLLQHPRIRFHVQQVRWPSLEFQELRDRNVDLVLSRSVNALVRDGLEEDLHAEVLFDDPFSAVVGHHSRWARRKQIDIADLVDEPWIVTPPDVLAGRFLAEAFERRGLKPPMPRVATSSIHLRQNLASRGQYISVLPASVLRLSAKQFALKQLPIELSDKPAPVTVVTIKARTLSPAAQLFIQWAREVGRQFGPNPKRVRGA